MKTYIGVKVIKAEPMSLGAFKTQEGRELEDGDMEKDGYHVMYPDSYHSWSPKHVFDEAYRELSLGEISLLPVPGVKDFAEARKTMSVHLNQDDELRTGYEANVAMFFSDRCNIVDHDDSNKKAKELLNIIFG